MADPSPDSLIAAEFLRWSRADYEEAILAVTGVWEYGHGAYIEFADADGPTRMSLVIATALRMAASMAMSAEEVMAQMKQGEKHDDDPAEGSPPRGDEQT